MIWPFKRPLLKSWTHVRDDILLIEVSDGRRIRVHGGVGAWDADTGARVLPKDASSIYFGRYGEAIRKAFWEHNDKKALEKAEKEKKA